MTENDGPGYWMAETSSVLRPAVEAYLKDVEMTDDQIATMRAYLRQWIEKGNWIGGSIGDLRAMVGRIKTRADIHEWVYRAELEGIDPL